MTVWGLILNGIGAFLIATGQEIMSRVTHTWLRAHEAILGLLVTRSDAEQISGVDEQMDRALRRTARFLGLAGFCFSWGSCCRSFRIFGTTGGVPFVSRCLISARLNQTEPMPG